MNIHHVSDKKITLDHLAEIIKGNVSITLSQEAKDRITKCREYLDNKIATSTAPVYGINTGFGSLYNKNIANHQLAQLQENLVKSHACGTGPEVPEDIVKLMLFLKVQSLA